MDPFTPIWMIYAGVIFQYLLLCIPGVILIRVFRRFVRTTRRIEFITLATMRALLIAPVPFSEQYISIYPFPIAVLQYFSGDGTHTTTSSFLLPLGITFLGSMALSQAKTEYDGMFTDKRQRDSKDA
jgi:hypothetical protein